VIVRLHCAARKGLPAYLAARSKAVHEQALSFTIARAHDRQPALREAHALEADSPNEGHLPTVRGPDRTGRVARMG
jgi:hypothetical protein